VFITRLETANGKYMSRRYHGN